MTDETKRDDYEPATCPECESEDLKINSDAAGWFIECHKCEWVSAITLTRPKI